MRGIILFRYMAEGQIEEERDRGIEIEDRGQKHGREVEGDRDGEIEDHNRIRETERGGGRQR